ncbi:MAG: carboxypeptidase-like regulatory domain-containing protein [Cytophagales bacterium]|nr:carboxypeptidase-like regulatory domain-containing protein [Cytophagales bacterium]
MKLKIIVLRLFPVCYFLMLTCFLSCVERQEISRLNGTLAGEVILFDVMGNELGSHAEVTIRVDNGISTYQATSDVEGRFEFPQLPTGTYDITFTKDGYGTYAKYGYAFVGGENTAFIPEPVTLVAHSYIYLGNLEMEIVTIDDLTQFSAKADLLYNPQELAFTGLRYYLSSVNNVSDANYTETGTTGVRLDQGKVLLNFEIKDKGLLSARKLYLIIYTCTSCDLFYPDITTGRNIHYTNNKRSSNMAEAFIP